MNADDITEAFEERAAIVEFCAGMHRAKAEVIAIREATARHGIDAGRVISAHRKAREAANA